MEALCRHRTWTDASDYYDHLLQGHRSQRDVAFLLGCLAAANIAWDYALDSEGELIFLGHQLEMPP